MRLTMLVLGLAFLTACGSHTVQQPTKTILIVPPDNLLLKCKVDKPPKVGEVDLTKAWIGQTGNLERCNKDKASIRAWIKRQQEVYRDR